MNQIQQIRKNAGMILTEDFGPTTGNFDDMVEEMRTLMSQGKTISLKAKEAHVNERYKGSVVEYILISK